MILEVQDFTLKYPDSAPAVNLIVYDSNVLFIATNGTLYRYQDGMKLGKIVGIRYSLDSFQVQ